MINPCSLIWYNFAYNSFYDLHRYCFIFMVIQGRLALPPPTPGETSKQVYGSVPRHSPLSHVTIVASIKKGFKCACPVQRSCKCISYKESCSTWSKCTCKEWDLRSQFNTDLLPTVHLGLIQDGPHSAPLDADTTPEQMEKLLWKTIQSQDAQT